MDTHELSFVVAYLRRNPDLYLGLLTAAHLDAPREHIDVPDGVRKAEIENYFRCAWFGWCGACFSPVVSFPDGARINWPAKNPHDCQPQVMDAPKPRYRAVAQ